MFKRKNIGVYLDSIVPAIGKDKGGEETLETILGFRIHPFSPELAAELDPMVRSTLWSIGKVDVQEKVKAITFELKLPSFAILFAAAPDMSHATIEVPYARLDASQVSAKKHKDVAGWALTFKVRIPTPDAESLAKLHYGYTRQHFLTFVPAAPDLIDAMERPADQPPPRAKRERKPAAGAATDVH
jgi:hypothetical protein